MNTSPGLHGAGPEGYRKAWAGGATVAAALSALGMLASLGPAFTLLLLGAMAGLGACCGAALGPLLPGLRRPVLTGSSVHVCATLAVVGIALAPGAWGLSVVLLLTATAPPVVSRLGDVARGGSGQSAPSDPAPTPDGLGAFLHAADDDELSVGWHRSTLALQQAQTVEALARVVSVRQAYLDELERRAPEEFGTWISTQAFNGAPPRRSRRPRERG